jgi:hypothetical protein
MSPWYLSDRADPAARVLADRHYNRQKVGSKQFVPPGRCLVLTTLLGDAFWVTSYPYAEHVKHRWRGAWVCSAFRNEGLSRSSDLVAAAVRATAYRWPILPEVQSWIVVKRLPDRTLVEQVPISMVTFVDRDEVRSKRDPGRCFLRAGFEDAGDTRGGLRALVLRTTRIERSEAYRTRQATLFA